MSMGRRLGLGFTWDGQGGLPEKATSEQRPEGGQEVSHHTEISEECPRRPV